MRSRITEVTDVEGNVAVRINLQTARGIRAIVLKSVLSFEVLHPSNLCVESFSSIYEITDFKPRER